MTNTKIIGQRQTVKKGKLLVSVKIRKRIKNEKYTNTENKTEYPYSAENTDFKSIVKTTKT